MNLAASYARALYDLADKGTRGKDYLANLKAALKRRGHEKLLPNIFTEYQKLELGEKRAAAAKEVTPEAARTAQLLALYRKLITAGEEH